MRNNWSIKDKMKFEEKKTNFLTEFSSQLFPLLKITSIWFLSFHYFIFFHPFLFENLIRHELHHLTRQVDFKLTEHLPSIWKDISWFIESSLNKWKLEGIVKFKIKVIKGKMERIKISSIDNFIHIKHGCQNTFTAIPTIQHPVT